MDLTVPEIKDLLRNADEAGYAVLERSLVADTRKGVKQALAAARRRLDQEKAEEQRVRGMYEFEQALAAERGARCLVGLDEVGRGPLAGPLAVAAVVLKPDGFVAGLNDSKQIKEPQRAGVAQAAKDQALAWTVVMVEPSRIDEKGMTFCLREAFSRAVEQVEAVGVHPDLILLDGNPLHLDEREVNVIKGDAKCASIAAASVIAKVTRDALMVQADTDYPGYGFAQNKGYGTAEHCEKLRMSGLTPLHRRSFCASVLQKDPVQEALF